MRKETKESREELWGMSRRLRNGESSLSISVAGSRPPSMRITTGELLSRLLIRRRFRIVFGPVTPVRPFVISGAAVNH